jgi:hypothetical protein
MQCSGHRDHTCVGYPRTAPNPCQHEEIASICGCWVAQHPQQRIPCSQWIPAPIAAQGAPARLSMHPKAGQTAPKSSEIGLVHQFAANEAATPPCCSTYRAPVNTYTALGPGRHRDMCENVELCTPQVSLASTFGMRSKSLGQHTF